MLQVSVRSSLSLYIWEKSYFVHCEQASKKCTFSVIVLNILKGKNRWSTFWCSMLAGIHYSVAGVSAFRSKFSVNIWMFFISALKLLVNTYLFFMSEIQVVANPMHARQPQWVHGNARRFRACRSRNVFIQVEPDCSSQEWNASNAQIRNLLLYKQWDYTQSFTTVAVSCSMCGPWRPYALPANTSSATYDICSTLAAMMCTACSTQTRAQLCKLLTACPQDIHRMSSAHDCSMHRLSSNMLLDLAKTEPCGLRSLMFVLSTAASTLPQNREKL